MFHLLILGWEWICPSKRTKKGCSKGEGVGVLQRLLKGEGNQTKHPLHFRRCLWIEMMRMMMMTTIWQRKINLKLRQVMLLWQIFLLGVLSHVVVYIVAGSYWCMLEELSMLFRIVVPFFLDLLLMLCSSCWQRYVPKNHVPSVAFAWSKR